MTDIDPTATAATPQPLGRRLLAEFLGTGLLVAVVVGSGIAAAQLAPELITLGRSSDGLGGHYAT